MTQVTKAGGIIVPPVPSFYDLPRTVEDIVDQTVGRALDLLGLDTEGVHRWEGSKNAARRARVSRGAGGQAGEAGSAPAGTGAGPGEP
jgi:4-hydroxy-3-polyprenylbenzoate decarboxylase